MSNLSESSILIGSKPVTHKTYNEWGKWLALQHVNSLDSWLAAQSDLRMFPTVLINMMTEREILQFKMSREYEWTGWEWRKGFISTVFKWVWVKLERGWCFTNKSKKRLICCSDSSYVMKQVIFTKTNWAAYRGRVQRYRFLGILIMLPLKIPHYGLCSEGTPRMDCD